MTQAIDPQNPQESASEEAERLVPVNEAIRYRKRAQAAEQKLDETTRQLEEARSELDATRMTIGALEQRQRIDQLLTESDVVDLDAARLLTQAAVGSMEEPDIGRAVDELRRHKPYLFRQRVPHATAMPAHFDAPSTPTEQAAQQAADTGDRRDLLAYLRLRRRQQPAASR